MRFHDTLSRRKREFRPPGGKAVRIYTCGPSVYEYSHIGNFRTYLFEDVLVRYLRFRGYRVRRVMNITDVEDKAIEAARKAGVSLERQQKAKVSSFFRDFDKLRMVRPDVVAKASDYVPQMIGLISALSGRGLTKDERDGVYFDVRKFKGYGALAHLKDRRYLGIARKDDYSREGLYDFRLWKRWTRGDGKVWWDSPFGKGRPGWHIECSAIAISELGATLDIHCGGSDNIYPHHENEIAQSEGATGKRFADFWLHARHLTIGKRKMSKRVGNVLYVSHLEKMGVPPTCLRYYLISERYRNRLDFTQKDFETRILGCLEVRRVLGCLRRLRGGGDGRRGEALARKLLEGFEGAMDDDLNTRLALRRISAVFGEIAGLLRRRRMGRKDAAAVLAAMERIDSVMMIFLLHCDPQELSRASPASPACAPGPTSSR